MKAQRNWITPEGKSFVSFAIFLSSISNYTVALAFDFAFAFCSSI